MNLCANLFSTSQVLANGSDKDPTEGDIQRFAFRKP